MFYGFAFSHQRVIILGKETPVTFFGCCCFLIKKKRIKKASNRVARSKEEDTAVQEAAGKVGCLVIALS